VSNKPMASPRTQQRRRSPLVLLTWLLFIAVVALALALVVALHSGSQQAIPPTPVPVHAEGSTASLRTQVATLRQQATAQQTQIAQQQHTIQQLQSAIVGTRPSGCPSNNDYSYIATFQDRNFSYVLYLEWSEQAGFIRSGRLLAADNMDPRQSRSFTLGGADNAQNYGFTGHGQNITLTFSGIRANDCSTLAIAGVPWSVFYGFTGGTLTQKLHLVSGGVQAYNAAVAQLTAAPQ